MQVTPAINEYAQKKVGNVLEPFQHVVSSVDIRLSTRGGAKHVSKGGKYESSA
jgi:ribosome-associated translation inhibitor RaiA